MEKRLKVLVSNDSVEFQQEYGHVLEESGMELTYTQKDGVKLLEKSKQCTQMLYLQIFLCPSRWH